MRRLGVRFADLQGHLTLALVALERHGEESVRRLALSSRLRQGSFGFDKS
jgi:hypothetical protein